MKKEIKQNIKRAGKILFCLYLLCLVYFLFFSEDYGRIYSSEASYRYNYIPFLEIRRFWNYRKELGILAMVMNIGGNIVGFLPFGFILPIIAEKMRKGSLVTLSGLFISLTVELIQLFTKVGSFDVDDLILNTLGTVLGYILFILCDYIRREYYGKKI